jgi:hypothetical protein
MVWFSLFAWDHWTAWQWVEEDSNVAGLQAGQLVFIIEGPLADRTLAPGALVAVGSDERSRFGRIERCSLDRIYLVGWPERTPLTRSQIVGKVIRVVDPPR